MEEPKITKMSYSPEDGFKIDMEHSAVRIIAASLWKTFEDYGGINFISMDVGGLSDKGPIEVTIRPKWGTKTQSQIISELKSAISELVESVEGLMFDGGNQYISKTKEALEKAKGII